MLYDGAPFWQSSEEARQERLRRFGVLFQSGALWSSMTLAENIGLPLGEYTDLSPGGHRGHRPAQAGAGGAEGL